MDFGQPEDLYPLSPMQQGMLFHTLQSPASGVCFEQDVYHVAGDLDGGRFKRAWEQTVARHAVLRTTFLWDEIEEPHQIVYRSSSVELHSEDWNRLPAEEQESRLQAYLASERRRGFDLTKLPLMRLGLFRLGEHRHCFVWNYHHMILDGWSVPLVIKDLLAIYAADRRGGSLQVAALPAPPRPYRDFIGWLQQQDLGPAENHWRRRLEGFTAPTALTVDRRSGGQAADAEEAFGRVLREVPASIAEAATSFLRTHRITLSTLAQGAWALLLSRYASVEEVVFGCNVSGRSPELADAGEMVGLFINTLPLRIQVPRGMPVVQWLKSIQDQVFETLEYDFTPLVQVQKWSQVSGGQPLFDSMVVVENYPTVDNRAANSGLKLDYQAGAKHTQTGYPLTFLAWPGEQLRLEIKFDERRFERSTIERMMGHVETLLAGMVQDAGRAIDSVSLLDERERTEIVQGFNLPSLLPLTQLPRDGGATLHNLFETQASHRPDAIALTCEGQSLTYGELNAKANLVARELALCGLKPDTLVGLCLDRTNNLVIALLAILKAGGAYLPIDLAYPAERLAFMLEDAQAPVLLTETKLTSNLPPTKAKVLCVDEILARPVQPGDETNLPASSGPDHLAYVIYTSGTTGKPKGSLITHRNAVRLFPATEHWYGFGDIDVWTLFHSSAFDFSVWEIWGALLYGGRLVVVPFMVSRSPEAFYELLASEKVTVLNQTPSAFRQLIQAEEAVGQKDLALRYVIFGGEALEMQSLRPWFSRHGDQTPRLVNMYGITETTVHVTYRLLSKDDLDSGSVIGVPIPDLQIYILDARRQPVPIGVPGEMYVGGAGLARGYLRRTELTADRFIPDHVSGRPESRLYRTGDLARFLPGRDIEYLGRIDDQVKIRGFRIELGEIESVLCQHPAVREALVVAREDVPGSKRLVAYLVTPSPAPEVSALRDHLKKTVPEYMVPAAFVFLDCFPLTPNGKINRKALPVPDHRPGLANRFVAPRTLTEEKLAAIWSKVLRLERVGVHDNFFELGGDSILSIQVISMARRDGLKLTPKLLFAHQTIAELASAAGVPREAQPRCQDATGDVPLTPIQKWFFEQNLEESHHYNQAFLFEVTGKLDQGLLEGALNELSRHHDALRLRYVRHADGWRQFYSTADEPAPLTWADFSSLPEIEQIQSLERAAAATQAALNLSGGPLWRAVYFDLGPNLPARLLLVVHHLAVDGVSWRPLIEDLETAYLRLKSGQAVELSEKTTSYKTWAQQLAEFAQAESRREELAYWKNTTDPARVTEAVLPWIVDATTAENTEASASTLKVSLTAEQTQALLQQVPAAYNTQINDVLLTALARAWCRWSGSRVLFTSLEGHGRENLFEDVDLSRTVGWFTSIFPICLELGEMPDQWQPGEVLKSVKEQLRQIPNRGVGYGVLRYLSADTGLDSRMEPPMVFNYLGQFDQALADSKLFRFAKESSGPWHSPNQRRRHALEANSMVVNGRMEFSWTYCRHLHSETRMRRLTDEFLAALKELIEHCLSPQAGGRTSSDFGLARLDQMTIDRLVAGRRSIEDIYPLSPIQTLFVSANPGTVQTTFDQWQCTLTGQLNVDAFQRAWHDTVARHTILRTTIHSEGLSEPVQLVHRDVRLPWNVEDWSGKPADQHAALWSAYLKQDRAQPLILTEAPAMRLTLIRLSETKWKFLWSVPALLLDGWSWPLVFRDASQLYEAFSLSQAPQLEAVRPYRDYVEWLSKQSGDEAATFWRETLTGFREPTRITGAAPDHAGGEERFVRHAVKLTADVTAALQSTARRLQITVGTLVHGAWALQLGRQSGTADVVFGTAFAGRPADLHGVESIAGPFVNNLPLRVAVNQDAPVAEFFRELHTGLLRLNPFQFTPLIDIQEFSQVPWRHRMFDSLVVFQNYLVDESARRFGGQIGIAGFDGPIHTNYPMMLLAEPGDSLVLTLIYDQHVVAGDTVERWGRDLATLFERVPEFLEKPVAHLQALLSASVPATLRIDRTLRAESQNFVPPQTEMERTIAAVWQKMFGAERISIEDNFFDLGGHSLLLLRMHALLRKAVKTEFPIVTLLQFPSIRLLASHLDKPTTSGPDHGVRLRERAQRHEQALTQMRVRLRK